MYVGISLIVCVINLLLAPVADFFMRLGCHGKGQRILAGKQI